MNVEVPEWDEDADLPELSIFINKTHHFHPPSTPSLPISLNTISISRAKKARLRRKARLLLEAQHPKDTDATPSSVPVAKAAEEHGSEKKDKKKKKKSKEHAADSEPTPPVKSIEIDDTSSVIKRKKSKKEKQDSEDKPTATKRLASDEDEKQPAAAKDSKKKKKKISVDEPVAPKPAIAVQKKDAKKPESKDREETSSSGGKKVSATERLQGARFRMLNEQLYTTTGEKSLELFHDSPELFDVYHQGFSSQVKRWPVNPVDVIIADLRLKPSHMQIADFGCGEAKLAASVPHTVHSFDLVAANERVTACDMAHVPLPDASVHIAVFCLALMGTDYVDCLREANRVLVNGGELKIAEVISRIPKLDAFVALIVDLGFEVLHTDKSNTMFVLLAFRKTKKKPASIDSQRAATVLQPCIYKRR